LATLAQIWEGRASRLASNVLGSFAAIALEGPLTLGGPPAVDGAPRSGAVDDGVAASSSDSSSPLGQLVPPDPPLPIALFWIVMAGGVALIWFVVRRELGLPAGKRRWRP
jgi:hypothetical protein